MRAGQHQGVGGSEPRGGGEAEVPAAPGVEPEAEPAHPAGGDPRGDRLHQNPAGQT